jgi:hypothetical protein
MSNTKRNAHLHIISLFFVTESLWKKILHHKAQHCVSAKIQVKRTDSYLIIRRRLSKCEYLSMNREKEKNYFACKARNF